MKEKDEILDYENHLKWGKYVRNDEEILWEGKPLIEVSSKILTGNTYYDVMTGLSSPTIIYLLAVFVIARVIYGENGLSDAAPLIVVLIIIPFAFDWKFGKNSEKTEYAVTRKFVLFKFRKLFSNKIYCIKIKDLISVGYFEKGEKLATIYFVTKSDEKPVTYNLETGERRHYPTFEGVLGYDEIFSFLNRKANENKLPPLEFHDKISSPYILMILRRLVQVLLVVMVAYILDNFLIPSKVMEDKVTLVVSNVVDGFDFGATCYTEKGYSFGTVHRYDFDDDWANITITVSPIFASVKKVVNDQRDFVHKLDSGFNGLAIYAYILALISLLISHSLLGQKDLKQEILLQILAVNSIILILLVILWIIN